MFPVSIRRLKSTVILRLEELADVGCVKNIQSPEAIRKSKGDDVEILISNMVSPSKSAQSSVELLSVQLGFVTTLPVHPLIHSNVLVGGLEQ